jgi:hypothetical protein
METLSERACRTANKISLNMLYGETTGQRDRAGQMIEEAFVATMDLLEKIEPVDLREWFEQFHEIFSTTNSTLIDDPIAWSKFLGSQCDMLQKARFHQRTIAHVGNELANWDRQSLSFTEYASALNGLAELVTVHEALLSREIDRQSGRASKGRRHTLAFSHAVSGLAIVLLAINQAIELGNPSDENCAAMAMFGASLSVANVILLRRACEIAKAGD